MNIYDSEWARSLIDLTLKSVNKFYKIIAIEIQRLTCYSLAAKTTKTTIKN